VILHHVAHGDFSCWIRTSLQDDQLADTLEPIERELGNQVEPGRRALLRAIAERYGLDDSTEVIARRHQRWQAVRVADAE
jgi:hypothetical protein